MYKADWFNGYNSLSLDTKNTIKSWSDEIFYEWSM